METGKKKDGGGSNEAFYYKLDVGQLPDELYDETVPVKDWLKRVTTAPKKEGFPIGSLNQLSPITWDVELERIVGTSMYMFGNVFPFLVLPLLIASFFSQIANYVFYFMVFYASTLFSIHKYYCTPKFKMTDRPLIKENNPRYNQYFFTERNITKYLSVNYVWPKSMQRPSKIEDTPVIYCAVPHGAAPFGITAYPLWSKSWNDKLCHWTCAPIVLQIPIINYYLKQVGYVPAKSKNILDVLTKKEENIGVFLDGIAGMFQTKDEIAYLKQRKGIVKIALKAGVPLVPVYAFGHTSLWTVLVDPFGILKSLSMTLQTSLTPFFGRWGWFLGPPHRIPVTVCLGEPVFCPKTAEPTKEQINAYHQKLLDSYEEVFNKHKAAYGWGHKKLKFV